MTRDLKNCSLKYHLKEKSATPDSLPLTKIYHCLIAQGHHCMNITHLITKLARFI